MQKSSPSFGHSHSCQSLLLPVFSVTAALVFLFTGLSVTERERTVGKVLVSSVTWSYPVALYFCGEMISNRDMTQQTRASPPAAPGKLEHRMYLSPLFPANTSQPGPALSCAEQKQSPPLQRFLKQPRPT